MRREDYKLGPRRGEIYRLTGRPRRWRKLSPRAARDFESWLRLSAQDLIRPGKRRGNRVGSLNRGAFGRRKGTRVPGWILDVLHESGPGKDDLALIRQWIGRAREAFKTLKVDRAWWPEKFRPKDWKAPGDGALCVAIRADREVAPGGTPTIVLRACPISTRAAIAADWILGGARAWSQYTGLLTFLPVPRGGDSVAFGQAMRIALAEDGARDLMSAAKRLFAHLLL